MPVLGVSRHMEAEAVVRKSTKEKRRRHIYTYDTLGQPAQRLYPTLNAVTALSHHTQVR